MTERSDQTELDSPVPAGQVRPTPRACSCSHGVQMCVCSMASPEGGFQVSVPMLHGSKHTLTLASSERKQDLPESYLDDLCWLSAT